jgi:L-glyceraldehyde 3-phosphate reductase
MPAFDPERYDKMRYNYCGRWGLKLPAVSLGAWQTYGGYVADDVAKQCIFRAFDRGITHFDFANNYGEPNGNAETVCGRIFKQMPRHELLIATKAGFDMWPGPYGEWLSRKYLIASLDQSLQRLGLDYVDLFYAHRPDPNTPLDEVMDALDQIVRAGKALYVGLSNHSPDALRAMNAHAVACHTARPIISQSAYSLLDRRVEDGLLRTCAECGLGVIAFVPLAQGRLTNKYLDAERPADSRLARSQDVCARALADRTPIETIRRLDRVASRRGQSLAQMAVVWLLRRPEVTSVLIGASRPDQIEEDVAALENADFTDDELTEIDRILADAPPKP